MIIVVCRSQGKHSFLFSQPPILTSWASSAGKRECEGPLGSLFTIKCHDAYWGQKTWEQAEIKMQQYTLKALSNKSGIERFPLILSGDLTNQCISSSFALRKSGVPHLGLYGACSTMAESMLLGSVMVSSGCFPQAVAMASSHFATSERQYRYPLGYGGQRCPTAQWTVTGCGAVLISRRGNGPAVTSCTVGTITDLGIQDANNMGAAMAPAALATIQSHMEDFGRSPEDYDLILTGDLGQLGKELLLTLASKSGLQLDGKLEDCGTMVYDNVAQDVHSGGSGCGCSAIALCGKILNRIRSAELKRVLFCGTGALLSPVSVQQGLPIPAICHAVCIEGGAKWNM